MLHNPYCSPSTSRAAKTSGVNYIPPGLVSYQRAGSGLNPAANRGPPPAPLHRKWTPRRGHEGPWPGRTASRPGDSRPGRGPPSRPRPPPPNESPRNHCPDKEGRRKAGRPIPEETAFLTGANPAGEGGLPSPRPPRPARSPRGPRRRGRPGRRQGQEIAPRASVCSALRCPDERRPTGHRTGPGAAIRFAAVERRLRNPRRKRAARPLPPSARTNRGSPGAPRRNHKR